MIVAFFNETTGEIERQVATDDPDRVIETQNIQPGQSWAVYDDDDAASVELDTCHVDPETYELLSCEELTTPTEDFLDAREYDDVQGQLDALFEMVKGMTPEEERERREQVDEPPIQPHERPGEPGEGS